MFCPFCGFNNEESNSFCQQCGKQLPEKPVLIPVESVPPEQILPDKSDLSSPPVASNDPAIGKACGRCGRNYQSPIPPFCESCGYPLGSQEINPVLTERGAQKTQPGVIKLPTIKTFHPGGSKPIRKQTVFLLIGAAGILVFIGLFLIRGLQPANSTFMTSDACQPVTPGKNVEEANTHDLGGDLKRDTYFKSGQDYSISENGTLRIPDGITLIIEPGARVKFGQGARMVVHGELQACGSSNRRILFTADAKTGESGYWQGIEFINADKNSMIGHATFEYAGKNYHPVIKMDGGSINLEDLKFDSNQYYSLSFAPDSLPNFRPPLSVDNGPQGWEMHEGNLEDDLTWDSTEPLVIKGTLNIGEKSTLTVAAGSRIKFLPNAQLIVYGKIRAIGTSSQHIHITAARSDFSQEGEAGSNEAWSGLILKGTRSEADLIYVDYRYEEDEGNQ